MDEIIAKAKELADSAESDFVSDKDLLNQAEEFYENYLWLLLDKNLEQNLTLL